MTTNNFSGIGRQADLAVFARKIHRLGERPLYELFRELDRGADLRATLGIYAELPADFIKAYHGDRFDLVRELHGGRQ